MTFKKKKKVPASLMYGAQTRIWRNAPKQNEKNNEMIAPQVITRLIFLPSEGKIKGTQQRFIFCEMRCILIIRF